MQVCFLLYVFFNQPSIFFNSFMIIQLKTHASKGRLLLPSQMLGDSQILLRDCPLPISVTQGEGV
jgi:hypothetical protein